MIIMLDKFKWFKKKQEVEEVQPKKEVNVKDLDIEDFNNWFKNEYSGYGGYPGSAKGIFLRTDKLSSGMISDYFDYLNIDSDEYRFMDMVNDDWRKKLRRK